MDLEEVRSSSLPFLLSESCSHPPEIERIEADFKHAVSDPAFQKRKDKGNYLKGE